MKEKKPNHLNYLNEVMSQNPVWRDLAIATSSVINKMVSEPRWALSKIREPEVVQRGDWMDTPLGRGKVTLKRRYRKNLDTSKNTYDFEDVVEVEVPDQGFVTLPVRTLHTRDTLIAGSRLSGFDYFSDFLQDDDYARIYAYVGQYWHNSSGDNFVEFLGYIKRIRFDIEQLWTEESGHPGDPSTAYDPVSDADKYKSLEPLSVAGKKIWENPIFDWSAAQDPGYSGWQYPTSHVSLAYDAVDHPTIDQLGVMSLFYYLAPIHLVLERYVGTVFAKEDYYVGRAPQMHTIEQRAELWDTTAAVEIKVGTATQLHASQQVGYILDVATVTP